jgi:hypothetical protein
MLEEVCTVLTELQVHHFFTYVFMLKILALVV